MRRSPTDGMVIMPRIRSVLTSIDRIDKRDVTSDVLNVMERGMERDEQTQEAVTTY
jgi:hypothetical protein